MSPEEFDEITKIVCPYCRKGTVATQRPDTHEWQHVVSRKGALGTLKTVTLCAVSPLRNSRFARELS